MKTLIETKRLVFREISFDDQEGLFQLHSDPEVQRWTGEPVVKSIEEVEQLIHIRLNEYKTYGFGRLALILKEVNKFIGWAGLSYLPEFDSVDLGYRLKREYWGMGFATEVSKASIAYGFNKLGLDKIIAIALPENKASIKVLEKAGMIYDKIAPYNEIIEEAVWYKLEKKEYYKKT
ncbi:GNAT family N-acetyltransferase [Aquimarina sp. U1-2]|uniref:GNAT family N-acetyltransferase n=1 Tax=Aquimarina sp. U1-2 TaxID=2823141 RepID=UPI001AEC7437|nr:GNAT family N-acetyltransferase [Aquimarina sp. U1-2]MBP2830746.1 GNAT family N-acetyltransferase [Aquimarina sp. U1-2]